MRKVLVNGKVALVIYRTYSLREIPDALRYLVKGHPRGKVIITMR
ncbi:zinc-binding dehydrogenase [Chloroflexota bacterium]